MPKGSKKGSAMCCAVDEDTYPEGYVLCDEPPVKRTFLLVPDTKHVDVKHVDLDWDTQMALREADRTYSLLPGSELAPPEIREVPKVDNYSTLTIFNPWYGIKLKFLRSFSHLFYRNYALSFDDYGKPNTKLDWTGDEYFVEQIVAGVDPCGVKRLDAKTAELFDSKGNLFPQQNGVTYYCVNYEPLVEYCRQLNDPKKKHYTPAAACVLKYAEGKFSPVAILIDQSVPRSEFQIVVCDGQNSYLWRFAKMCVQVAKTVCHELGSHLGLTHLIMESICVATHATLPKTHPVFQLLIPHFYLTLPLNVAARTDLLPVSLADRMFSFNVQQCFAIAAKLFNAFDFNAKHPLRDMAARGVADLPDEAYPYGVTAKKSWGWIVEYVRDVLEQLRSSMLAKGPLVEQDTCIRGWCQRMKEVMPGFPNVATDEDLTEALAMVIFTGTHQHAAVNYFQYRYMGFVPACPSYLNRRPPADLLTRDIDVKFLLSMLPSPARASEVRALLQTLSDPPKSKNMLVNFIPSFPDSHFVAWPKLQELLSKFQMGLDAALPELPDDSQMTASLLARSVLV